MSKDIDVSQASSWDKEEAEFNVKYLRDRGRFDEAKAAAEAAGVTVSGEDPHQGGTTVLDTHRQDTSVTGTNDTPEASVEKNANPDKVGPHGKNADQFTPDEDDEDEDSEYDEEDYNTWSNDDLRAELKRRELPQSGNKAELVARLEEDDEE